MKNIITLALILVSLVSKGQDLNDQPDKTNWQLFTYDQRYRLCIYQAPALARKTMAKHGSGYCRHRVYLPF